MTNESGIGAQWRIWFPTFPGVRPISCFHFPPPSPGPVLDVSAPTGRCTRPYLSGIEVGTSAQLVATRAPGEVSSLSNVSSFSHCRRVRRRRRCSGVRTREWSFSDVAARQASVQADAADAGFAGFDVEISRSLAGIAQINPDAIATALPASAGRGSRRRGKLRCAGLHKRCPRPQPPGARPGCSRTPIPE